MRNCIAQQIRKQLTQASVIALERELNVQLRFDRSLWPCQTDFGGHMQKFRFDRSFLCQQYKAAAEATSRDSRRLSIRSLIRFMLPVTTAWTDPLKRSAGPTAPPSAADSWLEHRFAVRTITNYCRRSCKGNSIRRHRPSWPRPNVSMFVAVVRSTGTLTEDSHRLNSHAWQAVAGRSSDCTVDAQPQHEK